MTDRWFSRISGGIAVVHLELGNGFATRAFQNFEQAKGYLSGRCLFVLDL